MKKGEISEVEWKAKNYDKPAKIEYSDWRLKDKDEINETVE